MAELWDVIDLLLDDHRYIAVLLDRLDQEDDPEEMRSLFLRIATELAAHEAAEHDVVFPAARAVVRSRRHDIHDFTEEHEEVNSLLEEMLTLDPASAGFTKRASALDFELRGHFAEEEEILFPALRAALDGAALEELGLRVRAAKRTAPIFPIV